MMNKHFLYATILCLPANSMGQEVCFSYNTFNKECQEWGTGKAETIDVAVKLCWPGMEGKQIKSLSVPLTGEIDGAISNVSGFITSELKTRNQAGKKINDPDICDVSGSIQGNTLTVNFPESYIIPAEGVFVGYSITVTDAAKAPKPIAVVKGCGSDNSLWYHSTESQQRWYNEGADSGLSSAMTVTLSGELNRCSAIPYMNGKLYCASDKPSTVDVYVISLGAEPIKSVEYSRLVNDVRHSATYTFPTAIPSFGRGAVMPVEIEALGEPMLTSLDITIDKVNGEPNQAATFATTNSLEVLPFIPHNRPLVEEYTGLRCGYCPMGWVILRQMAEDYGRNEFVALSFHSGWYENGCMVYLETKQFPYQPDGYPAAQVNRAGKCSVKNIATEWQQQRKELAEGEISVTLRRDESNPETLHATSHTRFIHDNEDGRYSVSFALVADGLSDPSWRQYNAYYGQSENTSGFESDYWNIFIGKEQNIKGLTYDDIVLYMPDAQGIEGSLPSEIEAGREYENEFTVDTSTLVNVVGERAVTNFDKSRVVALIVDSKTGKVVNCASSDYADGSKILSNREIEESQITETIYYDLYGRRVTTPAHGIFIEISRKADGTTASRKVIL